MEFIPRRRPPHLCFLPLLGGFTSGQPPPGRPGPDTFGRLTTAVAADFRTTWTPAGHSCPGAHRICPRGRSGPYRNSPPPPRVGGPGPPTRRSLYRNNWASWGPLGPLRGVERKGGEKGTFGPRREARSRPSVPAAPCPHVRVDGARLVNRLRPVQDTENGKNGHFRTNDEKKFCFFSLQKFGRGEKNETGLQICKIGPSTNSF